MGVIHFLLTLKAAVCRIFSLCSLAWIMSAISLGQVSITEEKTQRASLHQDKIHSDDDEELRDDLRHLSTSSLSRQYRFEEKLKKLESELSEEKEIWRTRYQELLLDQQALKKQREKYINLEDSLVSPDLDVNDGVMEPNVDIRDVLHRRPGNHVTTSASDFNSLELLDEQNSLQRPPLNYSFPLPYTPVFYAGSTKGRKTQKCFRVFAPRSPFDLAIGNRIKVLLPSGRIATGKVSKVGQLPGKVECHVGVDLEPSECWQQDRVYKEQHSFHSDPSSAIIVPFSKVLMVWE